MTISDKLFPDLSDKLPRINRCRDYHLYDGRGNRYLDLFLAGGTALFGHRPAGMSLRVKNTMAKGLYTGYPTAWTGRLKKELNRVLPGYSEILIFSSLFEAENWLVRRFSGGISGSGVFDPAVDSIPGRDGRVAEQIVPASALWRPFCPEPAGLSADGDSGRIAVRIPVLPFPGGLPGILCCTSGTASEEEQKRYNGDSIPPYITAGLVRAAALAGRGPEKGEGGNETHPLHRRLELSGWESRGPYLKYTGKKEAYGEIFRKALEKRILLPPSPETPAIIPGTFTRGEIVPLRELAGTL